MFNQNQGKSYVFSFDGIEMRMTVNSNAYIVSYIQSGQKIFIQAKELRLGVVSYSLNNGIWRTIDVSSQVSPAVITPPPGGGGGSNSNSNNLWWDGIYFVQNYPHLYPHPDVSYYQIYTQYDSYLIGNQLVHYQMGSFFVSTIATIGPIGIGAAIGALIGAMVGGALGAVVGAAIGVTIGAVLAYVEHVIYVDGQGAIWWWANLGFWHSISNIPWYIWFGGATAVAAWLWSQVSFWRVGDYTFINNIGLSNP